MPEFAFIARDVDGRKTDGVVEAASEAEAIATLSGRALFPISIEVTGAQQAAGGRISADLTATSFSQLSDLLSSGVPLLRAINILRGQSSNRNLKAVLGEIARRVEDGDTLSEAMARFPKSFSEMTVSMVRAGAEGGFLETALEQIAEFTQAQDDLKKQVIGAMLYPAILASVMTLVVFGLLLFAVPQFEPVFDTLREKGQLPVLTEMLLAVSDYLLFWTPVLGIALIVGGLLFNRWSKTDKGRRWTDGAKLRAPMAGPLYESFAVARFCRVLGTLLTNGVPILKALGISADAAGNRVLADAIDHATENISSGERLAEPLAASGSFPQPVVEMISVAEESNTLETVLVNIADRLERRAWRKLDVAVRALEPLMLVMLSGVVLVIVLALMVPMFKMSQVM